MIPKVIHYCWFGRGDKPKSVKKCIASWKKYCPDYEIIEWNEDNFDVNMSVYAKYCYDNKMYAFLSDYVRLWVIYNNGGIYMDTDVEVIKPLDELINNDAYYGFESNDYINTGVGFGAKKNHESVKYMMEEYDLNSERLVGCPKLNTQALLKMGLKLNGSKQTLKHNTAVYPINTFNPYDDITGVLNKTNDTYSIHWYSKSWMSKSSIIRSVLTKPFHRIFGNNCFGWLKK